MSMPSTVKVTRARLLLRDRILILGVGTDARSLADDVDPLLGGVVVSGAQARTTVHTLRNAYPDMVLLEQPDVHEHRAASPHAPFPFAEELDPDVLTLFDLEQTLEDYLDAQVRNGASLAILPTGFIPAEEFSTLTAVVEGANALHRDDVVLHLPVSYKWLSGAAGRAKLTQAVQRSRHPVALSMAHKSDPASQPGVAEGIHAILAAAADNLLLWHADLGALDALANGALGGAVGVSASKRHITEPGEQGFSPSGGRDKSPNVLLQLHKRYGKSNHLATQIFANGGEPTCALPVCGGRSLIRFTAATESVLEAHRHNLEALMALLRRILAATDRQVCWADMLAETVAAYEATRLETQVMTFKPEGGLKKWIELNPAPGLSV